MFGAVVRNSNTCSINHNVSSRAFKTDSVVPIPSLASEIRWSFNCISNTFSVNNTVSFVASNTSSGFVVFGAVVRYWYTYSILEDKSEWAFKTHIIVPIPGLASEVWWSSNCISNTFSVNNTVSFVASNTSSGFVVFGAVVRNSNTCSINHNVSSRAFKTDSVVPIPSLASEIRWSFNCISNTFSVNNTVSFVAW